MPQISIIVPIYNTEKYLHRCIDSILAQTFTDFELILVNDGSTDNSGKICDEYAEKDTRIVVIHKENEGVSSARNIGIEISTGNWITFVDSDDMIPIEYFSKFSFDCDFHICGIKLFGVNKLAIHPTEKQIRSTEIIQFIIDEFDKLYFPTIASKIFKSEIILKNKLSFNTNLKFGEDTHFVYNYLYYCNNIALYSQNYYYYIPNNVNKKYSLTTEEYNYHINELVDAISKLEKKYSATFSFLMHRINNIYLVSFYEYINSLQYPQLKKEMLKFKRYNLISYCCNLSAKEYIYLKIISRFPLVHFLLKNK